MNRGDDFSDMRQLVELAGGYLPDAAERAVEQLEAAVGAEHRDAFLEAVECFALHVDEGVIAALERDTVGLVGEEIRHAAVGTLLGNDVDDAPVGQVPGVFERRAGAVAGEHLRFPIAMAYDRRQNADFAQAVEDDAVARAGRQPLGIERPKLRECGVVENKFLIAIEQRDGRLDAIERTIVRRDLAIELALRRFDVGDVDRSAGRHAVDRYDDDVVRLALAAGDEVHAGLIALAGGDGFRDMLALARLEQFDLALEDLEFALGLDRFDVGRIDPDEASAWIAQPDGHRQGVKKSAA